ncbi:MAG: M15 family metallopeptidase [Armatimonadota bacterium]
MIEASDELRRRAYWTAQLEAAWEFMERIFEYPVEECGEPMLPLPLVAEEAGVEIACCPLPHVDGNPRLYWLRRGLAPNFLAAAREMNEHGWVLKLEDVFRTESMQRGNSRRDDVFLRVLDRTQWECGSNTPPLPLLLRRLGALVASAPKVGTHMSGSAMDISVLNRDTGEEIDRGGPYPEISERTPMGSPFVSETARRNREEITALMRRHGFVEYPWEFWHYNACDAYEAVLLNSGQPPRYGAVHLNTSDGSVTPILEPNALLNEPGEIRALMERVLSKE